MSSILADGSYDLYSTPNLLGGMDMYGAEDQENNLNGTEESDSIKGSNLNDIIDGGNGFNYLNGQGGDDIITGGDDIDFILGGAGDDVINGQGGSNNIFGGGGKDTFVLEFFDGVDTISDFNVDEDKIRIKGVGADADVEYDEVTGKLSVNGQDIADLGAGLKFNDNNYEIF